MVMGFMVEADLFEVSPCRYLCIPEERDVVVFDGDVILVRWHFCQHLMKRMFWEEYGVLCENGGAL